MQAPLLSLPKGSALFTLSIVMVVRSAVPCIFTPSLCMREPIFATDGYIPSMAAICWGSSPIGSP